MLFENTNKKKLCTSLIFTFSVVNRHYPILQDGMNATIIERITIVVQTYLLVITEVSRKDKIGFNNLLIPVLACCPPFFC